MLPSLSPNFTRLLFIPGVALLFLPKINLLGVGSETAGIRIDDIVLLAVACLLLAGFLYARRTAFHPVEQAVAFFITASLFSNAVNTYFEDRSNPLYSVRYAEYFVFFYLGYYFAARHSLAKLAGWIAVINGIAICLQLVGLLGQFTSEGFVARSSRPCGLTGGPWEVGAVLNFCFAILVLDNKHRRPIRFVMLVFGYTSTLIVITGARMPMLANLALLLMCFGQRSRSYLSFTFKAAVSGLCLWACITLIPTELSKRSKNLTSSENLEVFSEIYRATNVMKGSPDWPEVPATVDVDMSWLMRTFKWAAAVKTWADTVSSFTLGIGPGTLGTALDGGWLRVLTETGVLGLVLFLLLMFRLVQIGTAMLGVVLALMVSMLMIDIHIAYKAMSLVFFASGYYGGRNGLVASGRLFLPSHLLVDQNLVTSEASAPQHHATGLA